MASILPRSSQFRTAVYGTVFARRAEAVQRLHSGDPLILVPDPPGVEQPNVWVHAPGGDVVGHLSPDVNRWMVPWMLEGARCRGEVLHVGGTEVESWKRLEIMVYCRPA